MRQYKTSKKNRATYTYYSADGKKLMELVPGENGVTEADIAMLHEQDDLEYNAQRREDYHAPVHYDNYTVSDGQDGTDRNPYLTDTDSSPEDLLLGALDVSERKAAIRVLWDALLPQQRELVLKNDTKYGRITSVKNGATFECIATAENGWHAIVVNAQIGWVSGKYSEIIQ